MKTQIIQLESHDDTISVKDKMGWGQTPRILLVWPKHAKILIRQLDIILLKRHSTLLGSQLAFVTRESIVRYLADQLEIPIYKSIRKAERAHWRPTRRRRKKKKETGKVLPSKHYDGILENKDGDYLEELRNLAHPRPKSWMIHPITRLILFTLGVMGVLAIAAVLVPNAEITISPQTKWQEITIPVIASSNIDTIDYFGVVPIHTLNVIVEGSGQIKTSGEVLLPYSKAHGNVMFTNLTSKVVSIPIGTVVGSSTNESARFSTVEMAIVQSSSTSHLIAVEAVELGSKGNVSPNELDSIEGPLGLDLAVTNPLGIYNGKDQSSPAPSEEDYKNLLSITLSRLQEAALEELNSRQDSEHFFLLANPEDYQILEEVYNPAEIQPSDQLNISLRIDYRADTVSESDLMDLGRYLLQANLPNMYSPVSSTSMIIDHEDPPLLMENGTYQWPIQVKWQIGATIDQESIVPLLLWEKPESAVEKLKTYFPNDEEITYHVRPNWWPRLPILPFRLKLVIDY